MSEPDSTLKNINDNLEKSKEMIKILNEYILFFNSEHNSYGQTFFESVELDKLSSTNIQMESLYNHMTFFNENNNNRNTEIFENISDINAKKGDILYGIFKESTAKCIVASYSLFSLLIEIINIKSNRKNNKYFIKELTV